MPAAYCTVADLPEVVLQDYLDAAEELTPGIQAKAVAAANAQVEDALRPLYVLPLFSVPDTLRQIATILAAHRVVGQVPKMISEQSFMYLLDQVREARAGLGRIRNGKDDLGFERLGVEAVSDSSVAVVTRKRVFDDDTWGRF
jgi:phage gp36-like protein